MLGSYSQVFALGHRAVTGILDFPLVVQEKIDGSQFSFGVTGGPEDPPVLHMRSKGAEVFPEAKDKLFKPAVATVVELFNAGKLLPGAIYRGEVVSSPKHNVLCYDRTPAGCIILFDVDLGGEAYASPTFVAARAANIGLECVPTLYEGNITSLEQVTAFLDRVSILGGSKIEGVVLKAYGHYGLDKKTLMAKYVSEAFKEVHKGEFAKANPTRSDVIELLITEYKSPARWQKAVQHLRERGELQDAPADIGKLINEVPADIEQEAKADIVDRLWAHFWPQIRRGVTGGLPQWYKDQLAQRAFEPKTEADIIDPRPLATQDAAVEPNDPFARRTT